VAEQLHEPLPHRASEALDLEETGVRRLSLLRAELAIDFGAPAAAHQSKKPCNFKRASAFTIVLQASLVTFCR
jgi:hypothetical protein